MIRLLDLLAAEPELFTGIALPDALDHDSVVNAILLEGAELAPISSDPELFRQMCAHYFASRLSIHEQLVSLVSLEYDPISNYDRIEESSEREELEGSREQSTQSSSEGSASRRVSAYNTDALQPSDASETSGTATASGEELEARDVTRTRSSRIKGNIGVTTSQQMIESSIDLMARLDVYSYIAIDFRHTLLVSVY